MKKSVFARLMATVIIIIFAASSCTKQKNKVQFGGQMVDTTINVVTDFPHESDAFAMNFPLDEFKRADVKRKRELIDQHRRMLVANVRRALGECIKPNDIKFVFGSGIATNVKDGNGKKNHGKFVNEVVIIVNAPQCKINGTWFLTCGNGMMGDFKFYNQTDFGSGCEILIERGKGLAHYKPQLEEWGMLATELNIPIKDANGKIVGSSTFLEYLGKYESVLFTGDRINPCTGEVRNQRGQLVEFETRLNETKKANKAIADSIAKAKKEQQQKKQLKKSSKKQTKQRTKK